MAVSPAPRERFLGLRAAIDLRHGRPFDTAGPRPRFYMDALWGFQLKESAEGHTRLVVSGYAAARPRLLQVVADFLFWEPAHWIMQMRQFRNLKRRAERKPLPPMSRETSDGDCRARLNVTHDLRGQPVGEELRSRQSPLPRHVLLADDNTAVFDLALRRLGGIVGAPLRVRV
jgi:hypothetical protein